MTENLHSIRDSTVSTNYVISAYLTSTYLSVYKRPHSTNILKNFHRSWWWIAFRETSLPEIEWQCSKVTVQRTPNIRISKHKRRFSNSKVPFILWIQLVLLNLLIFLLRPNDISLVEQPPFQKLHIYMHLQTDISMLYLRDWKPHVPF